MSEELKQYTPIELLAFLTETYKQKLCKTKKTNFELIDVYNYVYRSKLPKQCGGNELLCVKKSDTSRMWLITILPTKAKENRGQYGKGRPKISINE